MSHSIWPPNNVENEALSGFYNFLPDLKDLLDTKADHAIMLAKEIFCWKFSGGVATWEKICNADDDMLTL
eukprot:GSA25T00003825001.1